MSTAALPPSPLFGRRERLWPTMVVSLAVHVLFVGLVLYRRPPAVLDLNQKPIVAKLVRLGEVRPKEWLPQKAATPPPGPIAAAPPAPAPEPPKPAPPAPDAMAPPKAAPPPKPAAPAKTAPVATTQTGGGGLASVLSKVERDRKIYGSPDGDPRGDADEGEGGDEYLGLVTRALKDTYNLPATISEQERMHLRAVVVLFIQPDGTIARHEFQSRSGNPTFDAALERAVRSARLPPPPAQVRERYRTQGLEVLYRP
jgi:colicin import membrane protein/protein TonB